MRSTITATLSQLVEGHARANGPSEEQRTQQFVDAVRLRAGVSPAQLTAVHVWQSARLLRDAAYLRLEQVRRGEIHESREDAEDAYDAAYEAWVEADGNLFRLCGEVEAEVSIRV